MATAREKNRELANRITNRTGITCTIEQADTLRRAELTLQRWAERECGDGSNWHIERDEASGVPFLHYHGDGPSRKPQRTPDLESGAIRRVNRLCSELGLHYFHQADPRGCMLYVAAIPLTGTNYTQGVACCA